MKQKVTTRLLAACMLAALFLCFNAFTIAEANGGDAADDCIITAELEYEFIEADGYNEYEGYQITAITEDFLESLTPDSKIKILIPAYYDDSPIGGDHGKYPVVSIEVFAMYISKQDVAFTVSDIDFSDASNLKEIKGSSFTPLAPFISSSFEVLDLSACKSLSFIGFEAFAGLNTVKEIRLNKASEYYDDSGEADLLIQGFVFKGCTSLTAVYLDYIGSFALDVFKDCPNLKLFIFDNNDRYMTAMDSLSELEKDPWFWEDRPEISKIKDMLTYPIEVTFEFDDYDNGKGTALKCYKLCYQSIKYIKNEVNGVWYFDINFRLPRFNKERTVTEWYSRGNNMEDPGFIIGSNHYYGYVYEVFDIKAVAKSEETKFFTSTTLDSLKEHFEIWPDFRWGYINGCDLRAFYYSDYILSLSNNTQLLSAGQNIVTVMFWDLQCEFTVQAEAVTLETISVKFTQDDKIIKEGADLNSLRDMLTVTGINNDGSSYGLITNYQLSGELTEGVCEITVSYNDTADYIYVTVLKDSDGWYYIPIIILSALTICTLAIYWIYKNKRKASFPAHLSDSTAEVINNSSVASDTVINSDVAGEKQNYLSADEVEAVRDILRDKNTPPSDNNPSVFLSYNFTLRECEVALLLLEGKNRKEIAARLFISETTAKGHIRSIFHKFGCSDTAGFILKYNSIKKE